MVKNDTSLKRMDCLLVSSQLSDQNSHPLNYCVSFSIFEFLQSVTTIITKSFILTPFNLWFLGAFEKYLFFILVLTVISEKHHVIKQLSW